MSNQDHMGRIPSKNQLRRPLKKQAKVNDDLNVQVQQAQLARRLTGHVDTEKLAKQNQQAAPTPAATSSQYGEIPRKSPYGSSFNGL